MDLIRPAAAGDFASILRLNAIEVTQTSPLDGAGLDALAGMASYLKVVESRGAVAAFLLALREKAPYASDNYRWFAARFDRFIYVDRIVVDPGAARRGLGMRLYRDLFEIARADRVPRVVCEYNLEPPNPASKAFHDRFGFREVGTQRVAAGTKLVSLQVAEL